MNTQKTIKFVTPHSSEECYQRIKDSLATSFLSYFESKPIAGSISRSGMRIRKRISYRNSFQTELKARIKSRGNGSEIYGTLGLNTFVKIFMRFFLTFAIVFGGIGFIAGLYTALANNTDKDNLWLAFVVPPALIIFGFILPRIGKHFARHESDYLKDFLIKTLDAKEVK
jgi:hypothetical protein